MGLDVMCYELKEFSRPNIESCNIFKICRPKTDIYNIFKICRTKREVRDITNKLQCYGIKPNMFNVQKEKPGGLFRSEFSYYYGETKWKGPMYSIKLFFDFDSPELFYFRKPYTPRNLETVTRTEGTITITVINGTDEFYKELDEISKDECGVSPIVDLPDIIFKKENLQRLLDKNLIVDHYVDEWKKMLEVFETGKHILFHSW